MAGRNIRSWPAVCLVALALACGCSDSDDVTDEGSSPEAPSAEGATGQSTTPSPDVHLTSADGLALSQSVLSSELGGSWDEPETKSGTVVAVTSCTGVYFSDDYADRSDGPFELIEALDTLEGVSTVGSDGERVVQYGVAVVADPPTAERVIDEIVTQTNDCDKGDVTFVEDARPKTDQAFTVDGGDGDVVVARLGNVVMVVSGSEAADVDTLYEVLTDRATA